MRSVVRTVIIHAPNRSEADVQAEKLAEPYEERMFFNGCFVSEVWTMIDTGHPAPEGPLYRVPGVWAASFRSTFD